MRPPAAPSPLVCSVECTNWPAATMRRPRRRGLLHAGAEPHGIACGVADREGRRARDASRPRPRWPQVCGRSPWAADRRGPRRLGTAGAAAQFDVLHAAGHRQRPRELVRARARARGSCSTGAWPEPSGAQPRRRSKSSSARCRGAGAGAGRWRLGRTAGGGGGGRRRRPRPTPRSRDHSTRRWHRPPARRSSSGCPRTRPVTLKRRHAHADAGTSPSTRPVRSRARAGRRRWRCQPADPRTAAPTAPQPGPQRRPAAARRSPSPRTDTSRPARREAGKPAIGRRT